MQRELIENIININAKIEDVCSSINKDKDEITLVAVSKRKSSELIEIALDNMINNFGENYAQELHEKAIAIKSSNIVWHFIGPMQSNKVKIIARHAHWIHTIDREKIIKRLNSECKKLNKIINACIQINISSEDSKSGCKPEELFELAKLIESMENINLKGIMVLPKITGDSKEEMRRSKELHEELMSVYPNANYLSMGTTSDFESAIQFGSNLIRVGELIFGKRL